MSLWYCTCRDVLTGPMARCASCSRVTSVGPILPDPPPALTVVTAELIPPPDAAGRATTQGDRPQ